MASGEWRVASGEWRVASGEWDNGNAWRVTCNGRNYCHEEALKNAKKGEPCFKLQKNSQ